MPELAQYLEHTVLKPDTAISDIARVCEEAAQFGFAAVCIPPLYVREARNMLGERSRTRLATVVGFPMGYSSISSKSDEIRRAMDEGASDIDAVLNISAVKSELWNHVSRDLDALTLATQSRGGTLKLILECGLLTTDELVRVIGMARDAGLPWLKTGTGFHGHNATPEMVKNLVRLSGNQFKIKAAGGIRTAEQAQALIEAGAHRIGTSSGMEMLKLR
jgi:deoxyribose-phosphate aldolase